MIKQLARGLIPTSLRASIRKYYNRLLMCKGDCFPNHCSDPSVLKCHVAYNKYGGYCVPLSSLHRPASSRILAGGVWEPDTIEFIVSHARVGDLIHAGTYFGDFLPALSRSRHEGAKVWAFEPNYESYRCASLTLLINGSQNVVLANAGLGERCETLILETSASNGTAHGGTSHILTENNINEASARNTQPVQVVTLDSAIPENRNVSLIHLDVEGFEIYALNGARNIIRRCMPIIVLETMPSNNWLYENLLPLGYHTGPILHGNTVLIPS